MYDNVEAVREAVDRDEASFGTLDSWIMYKLTGGADGGIHVTDGKSKSWQWFCVSKFWSCLGC